MEDQGKTVEAQGKAVNKQGKEVEGQGSGGRVDSGTGRSDPKHFLNRHPFVGHPPHTHTSYLAEVDGCVRGGDNGGDAPDWSFRNLGGRRKGACRLQEPLALTAREIPACGHMPTREHMLPAPQNSGSAGGGWAEPARPRRPRPPPRRPEATRKGSAVRGKCTVFEQESQPFRAVLPIQAGPA